MIPRWVARDGVGDNRHTVTPASTATENRPPARALRSSQVIGLHRFDRSRREQVLSAILAVGEQHTRKCEIVVHRRHQPGIPLLERRRTAPLTHRGFIGDDKRAVLRAISVYESI